MGKSSDPGVATSNTFFHLTLLLGFRWVAALNHRDPARARRNAEPVDPNGAAVSPPILPRSSNRVRQASSAASHEINDVEYHRGGE